MKAVVAAFNCDYEPSDGPPFQALASSVLSCVRPVHVEAHDGELLEGDGEVEGGDAGGGLQLVVAGEVAHHDDPPEHAHVLHQSEVSSQPCPPITAHLQHAAGEAAAHAVPEDVDAVGRGDIEGLVEVLGVGVNKVSQKFSQYSKKVKYCQDFVKCY